MDGESEGAAPGDEARGPFDPRLRWTEGLDVDADERDDSVDELPVAAEGEYLIVSQGGESEVGRSLPKPRRLPSALVLHGGDLIICQRRKRATVRTPLSRSEDDEAPLATKLVLVSIKYRSVAPRTRGRRYLMVTNESDDLLGWIDHSPPAWGFEPSAVRALAQLAELACETERFEVETDFEVAHPQWVG